MFAMNVDEGLFIPVVDIMLWLHEGPSKGLLIDSVTRGTDSKYFAATALR